MKPNTDLNSKQLDAVADFFNVVRNPLRLQIFKILEKGPKSVGEIQTILGNDPPSITHHLKLLVSIRVLDCQRSGKRKYYAIVPGVKEKILTIMEIIG